MPAARIASAVVFAQLVLVQVEEDRVVWARLAAELRDELLALHFHCSLELVARLMIQRDRPDYFTRLVIDPVGEALLEQHRLYFSPDRQGHCAFLGKSLRPISRAVFRPTPQVVWEVVWRFLAIG